MTGGWTPSTTAVDLLCLGTRRETVHRGTEGVGSLLFPCPSWVTKTFYVLVLYTFNSIFGCEGSPLKVTVLLFITEVHPGLMCVGRTSTREINLLERTHYDGGRLSLPLSRKFRGSLCV